MARGKNSLSSVWSSALLIALFWISSTSTAQAQISSLDELELGTSTSNDAEGSSSQDGYKLNELRGHLGSELRFFPMDRREQSGNEQLIFDAQATVSLRLNEYFNVVVVPWFYVDALDTKLLRYEPLEAYLEAHAENFDITAGEVMENFGIADTVNPIDIINRRDFATDLLDPQKRGELMLRAKWNLPGGRIVGDPRLGLYFLPLFRQTDFPTNHQRFFLQPGGATFIETGAQMPRDINALSYGVRFDHTLTSSLLSADIQYLALKGPSHTPLIGYRTNDMDSIELVPQYYGEWIFGGGLRAVPQPEGWSKFTIKSELAYKRPYLFSRYTNDLPTYSQQIRPNPYFQYVVGVDRSFSSIITEQGELTCTIEYAGEVSKKDVATLLRPFDSDLAVRLHLALGDFDRTELEARGIFDVKNGEIIAEAAFSRQLRLIHKDLKLQLKGRLLRSAPNESTLLSSYPSNNSSLTARLQYDY